jgi:REP element-mobilizing transposase RayT
MRQLKLNLDKGRWGGRRKGSGRKRLHSKGVSHRTREKVCRRSPTHINMKYKAFIKNKAFLQVLKRAILNSRNKGLRILHYSVQSNHVHFIIEADNNHILERGMRSLTVTMVKGIDKGKIQLQRYHLHVLRSLREVKNAVHYVCFNEEKHTGKRNINPYSSVCLILNTKFDYCVTTLDRGKSFLMNQIS